MATLAMHEVHARWMVNQELPHGIFGGAPGDRVRLGDVALADLTTPALRALLELWRTRGGVGGRELSLVTVAKRKATLRRALVVATEAGRLARVPDMPQIALPPLRPVGRLLKSYSELLRLRAALPLRRWEWVSVAVWTLQRPSDVERMRWGEIRLGSRTCTTTPFMLIRSTKTRRPHGIKVSCPPVLVDVLRARLTRLEQAGTPPAPTDPLVDPWPNVSKVLPLACIRVGLPPLSALGLRHTGISWAARRVGLTPALQAWGGWASFDMMQRFYVHALPHGLQQVTDELNSMAELDR